ncbi:hypothetical protein CNMCM5793_009248 [Aspergillus hiratsukae]|uniref:Uncharacterized protein n=1 Tax=Aspergillus hiratsukae TaxID=1194566 RepID=A0A8H6ULF0_9EURO|nr:hypothetical protein CNMCM5793_009248 [Aspergillus hiratsukae]KAF7155720.1 hypothetical protein CNMCM6106_006002 [Aspergillus hiratsukae]
MMEASEETAPQMSERPTRTDKSILLSTLRTLPKDPLGFSHLGMDGVWRNVDKVGNVISYRALSPEEIAEALNIFPGWMREKLEKKLEGVDGRDVTDMEQLMRPGKDLLPKFGEDEDVEGRDE